MGSRVCGTGFRGFSGLGEYLYGLIASHRVVRARGRLKSGFVRAPIRPKAEFRV